MIDLAKKSLHCPNCGANVAQDCVFCEYCKAVLSLTACPACFGPVFKGMDFCPSCGAEIERDEIANDKTLKCPRCERALVMTELAGTRLSECLHCGGIWLDRDTFQRICDEKGEQERVLIFPSPAKPEDVNPDGPPARMYVPCPECGELMQRKNFASSSGIIVDWCMPHCTWFDRRELQRIVNFIKEGGLAKRRQKEIASLKEEQERLRNMQIDNAMNTNGVVDFNTILEARQDDESLLGVAFSLYRKLFED